MNTQEELRQAFAEPENDTFIRTLRECSHPDGTHVRIRKSMAPVHR